MIVMHSHSEFTGRKSVVALGMFDGVHIGHQKLIRTAVELAKSMDAECIVCTFDRHPLSLLKPEIAPEPLMTLEENLHKFEQLGADCALIQPFTKEFAGMLPEDYIEQLVDSLHAKAIVIGENYSFGREGRGNAQMVRQRATKYGYRAQIVEPVADSEGLISSTRIRKLMKSGEEERAKALLDIRNTQEV
jgi:riboflavin kinase/FMN adenylyltransferase